MQGLKFLAVWIVVFGVVGMCSARYKGSQSTTKGSRDPLANMGKGDFNLLTTSDILAKANYQGDHDDLWSAHLAGRLDEEIHKNDPNWVKPKTTTAKPAAVKGKAKTTRAKAAPAARKVKKN